MAKTKVLLIFCNWEFPSTPAIGITSIATYLLDNGHEVKLFDDAPYLVDQKKDPRELNLSAKTTSKKELHSLPAENRLSDFKRLLNSYRPDVVGISSSRYGFLNGLEYLEIVKEVCPATKTIAGGPFALSVPDVIIDYDCVDMVAIGDGEQPLNEVCNLLAAGENHFHHVKGFWAKDQNKEIHKNPLYGLFDPDSLPPLRFDLFADQRFYRPIGGQVKRVLPLEISRGCPYKCSNCSVPLFDKVHKEFGGWFRAKSVETIRHDIDNYIQLYAPEYFFFMSPTFLGFKKEYTKAFIEMYSDYKIPFYMFTRPEKVKEDDLLKLKSIGLDRMSVGIECGNEEYRRKMLGRSYSNDLLIKAFNTLNDLNISVTTNVIIGLPDETKSMIFESIRLVKKIITENTNVTISIYQAYENTPLYMYCVEKGYYDKNFISTTNVFKPNIRNPHLPDEEVLRLFYTFNLYVLYDEADWPLIDAIDVSTDRGKEELVKLSKNKNLAARKTEDGCEYRIDHLSGNAAEELKSHDLPTPYSHC